MKHTTDDHNVQKDLKVKTLCSNVFWNSVQLLAFQLDAYDLQGDQLPSNRSLLVDDTVPPSGVTRYSVATELR
jgi:hypothetical protein